MNRSVWSAAVLVAAAFALGACTTSRFGAPVRVASAGPVMVEPEPVEPVPTGPMASSELPPLDGSPVPLGGGMEVAGLPPASAPIAPSRSAFVGSWSAREASGTSCRVQLSSAPALDLYRASASGCANKDLAARSISTSAAARWRRVCGPPGAASTAYSRNPEPRSPS
jgi:hypothetical protein